MPFQGLTLALNHTKVPCASGQGAHLQLKVHDLLWVGEHWHAVEKQQLQAGQGAV